MSDNERADFIARLRHEMTADVTQLHRIINKGPTVEAKPTADLDAGFAFGFCAGLWAGGGIVLIISLLIMGSP